MTDSPIPPTRELAEWAERNGLENLRMHLNSMDAMKRETVTTLGVLMASIAAALAYVIKAMDSHAMTPVAWGAACLVAWLFVVCVLLVTQCLRVADAPAPTNTPANLYQPTYSIDAVRAVELRNIDTRIEAAAARNRRTASWINRLRLLAIASPVVFLIAYGVAVVLPA